MKNRLLIAFFVLGTIMLTAMRSRPVYESPSEYQAIEQSIQTSEVQTISVELVCVGNWCCTDTYCCQKNCQLGNCCFQIGFADAGFNPLNNESKKDTDLLVPWASVQTF